MPCKAVLESYARATIGKPSILLKSLSRLTSVAPSASAVAATHRSFSSKLRPRCWPRGRRVAVGARRRERRVPRELAAVVVLPVAAHARFRRAPEHGRRPRVAVLALGLLVGSRQRPPFVVQHPTGATPAANGTPRTSSASRSRERDGRRAGCGGEILGSP